MALDVAYPHYSACLLSLQSRFSHITQFPVPRQQVWSTNIILLYILKAVNDYCVTWLAIVAFFFSPTPHGWSLWLPRPETGSLRINCGLISYLISKQVHVNTFRASYILSNLQERETSRFLERSCLLIACIQAWLSHCLPLEKPPTKKGFII